MILYCIFVLKSRCSNKKKLYLVFSPYQPSEEPNSRQFPRPYKEPKKLFKEPNLAREQSYGQPCCIEKPSPPTMEISIASKILCGTVGESC